MTEYTHPASNRNLITERTPFPFPAPAPMPSVSSWSVLPPHGAKFSRSNVVPGLAMFHPLSCHRVDCDCWDKDRVAQGEGMAWRLWEYACSTARDVVWLAFRESDLPRPVESVWRSVKRSLELDGAAGFRFPILPDGTPGFTVATVASPTTDLYSSLQFADLGHVSLTPIYAPNLQILETSREGPPKIRTVSDLYIVDDPPEILTRAMVAFCLARPRIQTGQRRAPYASGTQYKPGVSGFYTSPQKMNCPNCGVVWNGEIRDEDNTRHCFHCGGETHPAWREIPRGNVKTSSDAVLALREFRSSQAVDGSAFFEIPDEIPDNAVIELLEAYE